jgi:hypothetical protein
MLEEADQDFGMPLPPTQIAVQLSTKLIRRSGTTPTGSIRLDVMVQRLHRVQLGL